MKQEIRPSNSLERTTQLPEYDSFLEKIKHEIELEVERIIKEEDLIGEGRAGKVFEITIPSSSCPVCVKIWRPEILALAETDRLQYQRLQYRQPEEEFDLQDEIYARQSAHIPKPIAFGQVGNHTFMAMEQIKGHTVHDIIKAGAKMPEHMWAEIQTAIIRLHRECGVAHRDLHGGNIMIETNTPLEKDAIISGKVTIIDFGLSVHIMGGDPTIEDYELTISDKSVKYDDDFKYLDELKPRKAGSPFVRNTV